MMLDESASLFVRHDPSLAKASSPQGNHSTGLVACCSKYGDRSDERRFTLVEADDEDAAMVNPERGPDFSRGLCNNATKDMRYGRVWNSIAHPLIYNILLNVFWETPWLMGQY